MNFLQALIGPWLTVIYNPLMLIFTGLSLLQLWRGVNLVRAPISQWSLFVQNPLTAPKKRDAENVSFYIVVPISIFIHELGHALATWAFGGKVVEFGFFFFWGYVLPDRVFGPVQEWVLSASGTWGNLLVGLAVWLYWRNSESVTLRYLGKRVLRFQIFYALIYYPIFTVILSIGDWRTIYDFAATPVLSGATAAVHVAVLGTFWWLDRNSWFNIVAHDSAESEQAFERIRAAAAEQPDSLDAQQAWLVQLLQRNELRQAARVSAEMIKNWPESANAHAFFALTHSQSNQPLSRQALNSAETAVALGGLPPYLQTQMHELLGNHFLNRGDDIAAAGHFGQALATAQAVDQPWARQLETVVLQSRTVLHMRNRRYGEAEVDLQRALRLAEALGDQRQIAQCRARLEELAAVR
jgi:hypothetical protein